MTRDPEAFPPGAYHTIRAELKDALAERDAAVARADRMKLDRDVLKQRAQRYRAELAAAGARADKAEQALHEVVGSLTWSEAVAIASAALGEEQTP